jgi:hypothetical protein
MNVVKSLEQFEIESVYFTEPIKNNIINDSSFVRILYSTNTFVLNGIFLLVNFNNIVFEKYFNKYKCSYDVNSNKDIIEKLRLIELDIIKKASVYIKNKIGQSKIYEQISLGNLKLYSDNINKYNNTFILKISGIWETDNYYGLTYKFCLI